MQVRPAIDPAAPCSTNAMKRSRSDTGAKSRGSSSMGDETEASPFCSVCMNDEFYEDDQGGMICVTCGTQSQDFLAEGFDEDDLAVYGGGTGNMVTMRNESGRGNVANTGEKHRKLDEVPDVLEALKLYQYTLQMLFDACLECSNTLSADLNTQELADLNASYRNTLKSVWMDYLSRWNADRPTVCEPAFSSSKRPRIRAHKKCSIGASFTRSAQYRCNCSNVGSTQSHPLLPSKPLLMGLIYLTYRIMRSGVLVCDIVRWCETGLVPYANLWEAIPSKWRESVRVNMRWFYELSGSAGKKHFITPESILFHTCSVAQCIRVDTQYTSRAELPALNAPLVARHIIGSLGLPAVVWDMYVKITQLFTTATPIHGAQMLELHHEEIIMAVLIVAIKFCPRWTEWSLLSAPACKHNGVIAVPESMADLSSIRRDQLPQLLQQIRRTNKLYATLSETRKLSFPHNAAVYSALGGDVERLNKGLSHLAEDAAFPHSSGATHRAPHSDTPQWSKLMCYANTVQRSNVALHSHSLITEDLSLKNRRRLHYLNGVEPHNTRTSKHAEQSAYMAYTRYNNDRTSIMHMPYLILLERCAKYLYTNPSLLHDLVSKLEEQIVTLAFTGSCTNSSKPITFGTVEDIKPKHKIHSAGLEDVMRYREECDVTLRRIHRRSATSHRQHSAHSVPRGNNRHKNVGSTAQIDDSDSDTSSGSESDTNHDHAPMYNPIAALVFNPHGDFHDIEVAFGTHDMYTRDADQSETKRKKGIKKAARELQKKDDNNTNKNAGGESSGAIRSEGDLQYDTNEATSDNDDELGANYQRSKPLSVDYLREYATSQASHSSNDSDAEDEDDVGTPPVHHHSHQRQHSITGTSSSGVAHSNTASTVPTPQLRSLREDILQTMLAGNQNSSDSDSSAESFDPLRYARYTSQQDTTSQISNSSSMHHHGATASSVMDINSKDVTQRPVVALKRPRSQVQFQD